MTGTAAANVIATRTVTAIVTAIVTVAVTAIVAATGTVAGTDTSRTKQLIKNTGTLERYSRAPRPPFTRSFARCRTAGLHKDNTQLVGKGQWPRWMDDRIHLLSAFFF